MPFAILCAALLSSPIFALTETPPLPQGGQLDHFSYSVYLDEAKDKKRHFPRLRLPRVRMPKGIEKLKLSADKAKTAMKAVPVLAAAVAEIPAVREELRQRLGEDLAPHVVAGEALRRFKSEAQRLGAQAAATARELERQARGLVEGVAEEVNETVVMAEHVAEDLLHHSPPPRRATRPWVYFAFVFGVLLCGVGYRRSRRRPRRPTGTRGARGTSTPPRSGSNSVLPLAPRESVMQRAPSFSSLTPVRVNKVEFQRVEVTAPEWDSPSECEKESSAEVRQEGGLNMGKGDVKTEYYQISSRQDTPPLTSPRDPRNERAFGA
ncbi:Ribosomal RNA large subunit methyltransferase J [Durusdinium trenchii]|uniref:Ribosomal RNA large subunit methyltransferase J n=1 Tax=Durusdinium trenchii TaxID=1381693 RepID=A0ABP0L2W7_9DINO